MIVINKSDMTSGVKFLSPDRHVLYICSAYPSKPIDAGLFGLGKKVKPSLSLSVNRITVDAFCDGIIETSGYATHWALLYRNWFFRNNLKRPVYVSEGYNFSLDQINIYSSGLSQEASINEQVVCPYCETVGYRSLLKPDTCGLCGEILPE